MRKNTTMMNHQTAFVTVTSNLIGSTVGEKKQKASGDLVYD